MWRLTYLAYMPLYVMSEYCKRFWLLDEEDVNNDGGGDNVRKDLSDWQQRHALLVLSKLKVFPSLQLFYFLFPLGSYKLC